ncbi:MULTISPECIES: hypothetical protein [unclassified Mesorhizobium]|uniref:hypothetical protein n=1 Tax=unclassified Mesorhizobium TaxID=325217 RepID=UPI00112C9884|nr:MULTISPECIES: hypothetical protein [unclassified Mesorhizobium]TPI56168.1 hypothetical protein FJW11_00530 [Mesorhizobium sp. B3-1-1]TPJ70518.1 hypothetical protein FJ462_07460 [Mesorhizobium sp. B2-6-7]TPJ89289.1 hypothetical protein FJ422_05350 [Mesorhizobium sp. B2-6-3]TPK04370.1 hypothetical protein FJ491_05350 [Mesorhizobium sp. B2-5-10]TPK14810.1 hypothetical protein FJ490_05745 [Mesorhizobium sp. B2-5-11]
MDDRDKRTGRFLPGNKLGGRRGAISHRRRALEHLSSHGDAIITTAISAALGGDTQLLSLLVKMLIPTGGIPAEIPSGDPIEAYSEGEINSTELRQIMTSVEKARQLDATHKGDARKEPQRTTVLVDEDAAEIYRRMIETP